MAALNLALCTEGYSRSRYFPIKVRDVRRVVFELQPPDKLQLLAQGNFGNTYLTTANLAKLVKPSTQSFHNREYRF